MRCWRWATGASGSVDAADLVAVRDAALAVGLAVARVTQPYRVAGKRMPPTAPVLDAAWNAAVTHVRRTVGARLPLVLGGRSAGARVACRTGSRAEGGRGAGARLPAASAGPSGVEPRG
jgi:predicted alpha/beta-hydrolase family hydrolase